MCKWWQAGKGSADLFCPTRYFSERNRHYHPKNAPQYPEKRTIQTPPFTEWPGQIWSILQ